MVFFSDRMIAFLGDNIRVVWSLMSPTPKLWGTYVKSVIDHSMHCFLEDRLAFGDSVSNLDLERLSQLMTCFPPHERTSNQCIAMYTTATQRRENLYSIYIRNVMYRNRDS